MSQASIACVNLFKQDESQTSTDRGKVTVSGMTRDDLLENAKRWQEAEAKRKHALMLYVKNLINENAKYRHGSLSLFACELDQTDRKIFLSNIVDAEEYEWLCETPSRLEAGFKEYENYMQKLIDEYIDDVWHENMQDAGLTLGRYDDNGEIFYYRR